MQFFLSFLLLFGILGHCLGQEAILNQGPLNQKLDLAYSGVSIISGDFCQYNWHKEFNTLITTCHNSEGMLIGNQLKVVQSPIEQCYTANNMYILTASVSELARFFIKESTSSYYCCDVFEPGTGYLFTDCGGIEVFILREKLNSSVSLDYKSQAPVLGFT